MPGPGGLAGTMPGGRWLAVVKRKSTRKDLGEVHTTIGYTFVMEDLNKSWRRYWVFHC